MKGASNGGALCVESGTFEVTYVDTRCRLGKVRVKPSNGSSEVQETHSMASRLNNSVLFI